MATNRSSSPAGGQSKNRKQAAVAQVHDVSKTIRGQTKKDKAAAQSKAEMGDRAGLSKDVVKAVLASPLTVSWPNIPRHLQTATLHALKELIPADVADYHVSRARCHQQEKRVRRRQLRKDGKDEGLVEGKAGSVKSEVTGEDVPMSGMTSDDQPVIGEKRKSADLSSSGQPAAKKPRTVDTTRTTAADGTQSSTVTVDRPIKPVILSDLVLGINEVIKSLETHIDQLKVQLLMMGDALSGRQFTKPSSVNAGEGKERDVGHLLPTAPRSPSPEPDTVNPSESKDTATPSLATSSPRAPPLPLEFVVVPLLSVNPPSLVSPIPQYCATYNALVYQHQQLARICRTRVKKDQLDELIGVEREECRVVPLGDVELEMAQLVGLRRLACLGVRSSHPNIEIIRKLLPKSVLHSPRHALTLPIPTSTLNFHTTTTTKMKSSSKASQRQSGGAASTKTAKTSVLPVPVPDVHYADLHIKGIQTKMPVDNTARKAKRLEEVRRKRVEAKLRKKEGKRRGKA
ncbi:hypothetical protein IAT40_001206 [Kwoniella sp. CBS 6097]